MTCGPVLIQWFPAVGAVAYGSVLLASVPPASMYMKPTFSGGALCDIHAPAHSIAFASRHMADGPGAVGVSGMHVYPFVPFRTTRMLPSFPIATIVALSATGFGAADIALAMIWASVAAGAGLWGWTLAAVATTKVTTTKN